MADLTDATVVQAEEHQMQAQALSLGPAPPRPPDIPGYQLTEKLGQGSFGEVWSGLQVRTGQSVAVKIITVSASMNWRYLEHEVARLRQVAEHPHVVTLLDADLQHTPPFFVMTLHSRTLQGWTGAVNQVVGWLEQMARALNYTHSRGLLHCDLKPSNVLLDNEGMARLSDFGQSVGRGEPSKSLGSLGYMSPEQAARQSIPDVSWDIYGLGATIYALLTGQTPRLDDACRLELATLSDPDSKLQRYLEILKQRPLVPIRRLNPAVDRDLAAIVENCLAFEPERRTPQMSQILEDLDRRRSHLPLLCRRPWSAGYRLRRYVRRQGHLVALGLVALTCLGYVGHTRLESEAVTRSLLARQEWERGWSLQRAGREAEALLWWARQGVNDDDHALAIASPTARLIDLKQRAQPATAMAYGQDGQLMVASEAGVWLGERFWPSNSPHSCQDLGPYRIPRATAAFCGPGTVVARMGDRLELLNSGSSGSVLQDHFGTCTGALVVHGQQVLFSEQGRLRVLDTRTRRSLVLSESASGDLTVGALSSQWAACARDKEIRVWDLATGRPLPIRIGHDDKINCVCFSSDGRWLASSGDDNRARLWELPSGRRVAQVQGKMMMMSSKFSPDGRTLATCNYDGTVSLLNIPDLSVRATLKHRWMVYGVTFSASGRKLASRSVDGSARVWNSADGTPVSPFLEHLQPVRLTAFSPDENELATADLSGKIRRWALTPEPRLRTLQTAEERANWGDWKPNSQRAAVALGGQVQIWDCAAGRLLTTLSLQGVVNWAQFSRDGKVLATAGTELCFWDTETWQPLRSPQSLAQEVSAAAFSPDGRSLLTGGRRGQLLRHNVADGRVSEIGESEGVRISHVEFAPDGRSWVSCHSDQGLAGEARVHDARDNALLACLRHPQMGVTRAVFSPDSGRLLTCGENGQAYLWDSRDWHQLSDALSHSLGVWDAAWSPDGGLVVTASGDSTLRVYDQEGRPLTPPMQHDGPVVRVQFSEDGRRIVSASKDGTARLWDARSGQQLLAPVQHSDMVFVCRLSPKGDQLLTAANDGSIKLLDLSTQLLNAQQRRQQVARWTGLLLNDSGGVPRLEALSEKAWRAIP